MTRVDSAASWWRLAANVMLSAMGGVGMWSVVVALPSVQAEFGVARGTASLPYTVSMAALAIGGIFMGRLVDRVGVMLPVIGGALSLSLGYILAAQASSLWQFTLIQAVLIAFFGASTTFAPLVADTSLWFQRRRGIAVAICASGNYLAGMVWPPLLQHLIETIGWRGAHTTVGVICLVVMLPLTIMLRRRPPVDAGAEEAVEAVRFGVAGLSPGAVQALLVAAGLTCCIAMSMPQVHIVAYCADLGYGPAQGAAMLSLMLGFGIASRLASGFIADRIGGFATLLMGTMLQAVALVMYLGFNGLSSLYVVSALFGLFQGGIVPSYAMVVREIFPAREAASRISAVLMATIAGMAIGGWMSGAIFDLTGSYRAAFLNGIAWNFVNIGIVVLLWRARFVGRRLVWLGLEAGT
jgi:MFS family permease